jgi:hypothetical protein
MRLPVPQADGVTVSAGFEGIVTIVEAIDGDLGIIRSDEYNLERDVERASDLGGLSDVEGDLIDAPV